MEDITWLGVGHFALTSVLTLWPSVCVTYRVADFHNVEDMAGDGSIAILLDIDIGSLEGTPPTLQNTVTDQCHQCLIRLLDKVKLLLCKYCINRQLFLASLWGNSCLGVASVRICICWVVPLVAICWLWFSSNAPTTSTTKSRSTANCCLGFCLWGLCYHWQWTTESGF